MKAIILASASPRRQELLKQVGIEPEVFPSKIEEIVTSTVPEEVVCELAEQKARDVIRRYIGNECFVVAADTIVTIDGRILGKPKNEEDALNMLTKLQGRVHAVYTGVTVIDGMTCREETFAEKTEVAVFSMTKEEIQEYIATGDPMDKAGAYGIQGVFAAYIRGVCGDYNNVVGLPVGRLCQILKNWDKTSKEA